MANVRVVWDREAKGWRVRELKQQEAKVMVTLVLKNVEFNANGTVDGEFHHEGIRGENLAGCRRVVFDPLQDSEFFDAVSGHMVRYAEALWLTPLGNMFALAHELKEAA